MSESTWQRLCREALADLAVRVLSDARTDERTVKDAEQHLATRQSTQEQLAARVNADLTDRERAQLLAWADRVQARRRAERGGDQGQVTIVGIPDSE